CHAAVSSKQTNYCSNSSDVRLVEDTFGTFKNEAGKMETVRRFTLSNQNGMSVEIINYGATITSLHVPDRTGNVEDIVLGFDNVEEYLGPNNPYFGCVVGRVANRIGKGTFSIGSHEYNVTRNRGTYHLHGGTKGFDKALWEAHVDGNKVVFSYLSKCGEEGYPGHVLVQAAYQLSSNNELVLVMSATSTKPTPVNLTNHSYFNLAGHNKGRTGVLEHTMCINADRFTDVDHESIPTGELKCLAGTNMDLQVPRALDHVLSATGGIDHNYCINHCIHGGLIFVARLSETTRTRKRTPERQCIRHQMFLRCLFAVFSCVSVALNVQGWRVDDVTVVEDEYGILGNQTIKRYTFSNANGVTAEIITYGGRITAIKVPDICGEIRDVVLGFDNLEGFLQKNDPYFGAVLGRVANRIGGAKFILNGIQYNLTQNEGSNQLHGGLRGFDKVVWEPYLYNKKLTLSYVSVDGEEGFPGTVLTQVTYQLTSDNELIFSVKATTTKPTPINIANHAYFNLAGQAAGPEGLFQHEVSINANRYTVTDRQSIPTGEVAYVAGTDLEFCTPHKMGPLIQKRGGYDNNYCINRDGHAGPVFVSRVVHPESGRYLEIYSDQPGVQFYTGNGLPQPGSRDPLIGKGSVHYHQYGFKGVDLMQQQSKIQFLSVAAKFSQQRSEPWQYLLTHYHLQIWYNCWEDNEM
ncbi:hypothetical protein Cfor_09452, partial [Coptotermes formosanus]